MEWSPQTSVFSQKNGRNVGGSVDTGGESFRHSTESGYESTSRNIVQGSQAEDPCDGVKFIVVRQTDMFLTFREVLSKTATIMIAMN